MCVPSQFANRPTSNYGNRDTNVLDSLDTEWAQIAYLWASDKIDKSNLKYTAERYAREVDLVAGTLLLAKETLVEQHTALSNDNYTDLTRFILKRHCVKFFGSEKRMWWE